MDLHLPRVEEQTQQLHKAVAVKKHCGSGQVPRQEEKRLYFSQEMQTFKIDFIGGPNFFRFILINAHTLRRVYGRTDQRERTLLHSVGGYL